MKKKIFLLSLFFIFYYAQEAYAAPIVAVVAAVWHAALLHPIIAWATILSVSYSIYSSVNAMRMQDKMKYPSARYSAPTIDNTWSNEGIVPLIYGGPILVGGNILWQSDPAQTVYRFMGLCVGEVSAITNVYVDGQDILTLPGCSYTAYYGTSDQVVDARCGGVVKGLRDVAYLALTLTAGENVSSNPVVSCRVTGRKIKTWNSGTQSWDTNSLSPSKNPAAIIRDYLLLSQTLGGCGLPETAIDNASFGEVSEYCDELVARGSSIGYSNDPIQTASHQYTGGGTGASGIDGDFNTAQQVSGSGSHEITATHMFTDPVDINQLRYRLYAEANAYGDDWADASCYWRLEYTEDGSIWLLIDNA